MKEKLDGNYIKMPPAVLKKILEAAHLKTAAVLSIISYLTNHPIHDEQDILDTAKAEKNT